MPGLGRSDARPDRLVDRRAMRFLHKGGAWNHVAMQQAIADAGLEEAKSPTSAPASSWARAARRPRRSSRRPRSPLKNNSPKRIGPFAVPKAMSSTASATLATWFKIHGVNYSISSACSTSAHCIGNAAEMIQWGKQDVMFAGGHEDLDWTMSNLFDAMGAMSSKYNDRAGGRLARL
jgi:3-oxoacyl-[acyl-carrier-protein] synthase-1